MIISRGRSFIFVHAPKTGGTSMALALEARAMKDDIMLGDTPKAAKRRRRLAGVKARGRLWKHSTLGDVDGIVTPDEIAAMFVVTLVRNPWDRMVSYYHWLRAQSFDHPAVALAAQLPFGGFVGHPVVQASMQASPARHYVTDATGTERCNLFIRLEHWAQDVAPFEAHLGFALAMPHVNRSERIQDYRTHYDAEAQDAVGRICAEDIERFGYSFGLS